MNKQRGFTLIELMIVVAIIAILVAVGYPAYTDQVRKSRRADGKAALQQAMNHQERYYTSNNTYTTTMTDMDAYGADPAPSQEEWYTISAAACGGGIDQCVALTATAQNGQENDLCENFTLTSQGVRTVSGSGDCW